MRTSRIVQATTIVLSILIGTTQSCLTDGGASSFDEVFRSISTKQQDYLSLIPIFLSPDFQFHSDSLEFLIGGTLNATGANSPAEFLAKYVTPLPDPSPSRLLYIAHSCDTVTSYWQIIVGGIPIRGFNLIFVDIDTKKITKVYSEINNGAARYAICKVNSTACPQQVNFTIGDDGPPFGFSRCQPLLKSFS